MRAPSSAPEAGSVARWLGALREWLGFLNGDAAYRGFVAPQRRHHPERPIPSREEFFRMETDRRWNGVRRCC